ncbi:hypothetical protein D3C73_1583740 [compost metagenome]
MRHMASCDNAARPLAVAGLIVEKHIGGEGFKERRLVQTAKEQRLVKTDIPLAQRADHPFVRGC